MADNLKKGQPARVKVPAPEGVVARHRFDEDTGERFFLLEWKDADGEDHHRWFPEADLEATGPAPETLPEG